MRGTDWNVSDWDNSITAREGEGMWSYMWALIGCRSLDWRQNSPSLTYQWLISPKSISGTKKILLCFWYSVIHTFLIKWLRQKSLILVIDSTPPLSCNEDNEDVLKQNWTTSGVLFMHAYQQAVVRTSPWTMWVCSNGPFGESGEFIVSQLPSWDSFSDLWLLIL